jgi:hypothetical protein
MLEHRKANRRMTEYDPNADPQTMTDEQLAVRLYAICHNDTCTTCQPVITEAEARGVKA